MELAMISRCSHRTLAVLTFTCIASLASALFATGQNPPAAASSEQPIQLRTTFQFHLPVPPSQAAQFFGPEGERCWAGGQWDPHFLYPQPAHDQQDAVFTIAHGSYKMLWVNTAFDPAT